MNIKIEIIILGIIIVSLLLFAMVITIIIQKEPKVEIRGEKYTSEEMKTSFVDGCIDGNSSMYLICNCAYDTLVERYGLQGFADIVNSYDKTGILPKYALETVTSCIK